MTTIYAARRTLTMNPSRPEATHVAVRDGRILGAGSKLLPPIVVRRHAQHGVAPAVLIFRFDQLAARANGFAHRHPGMEALTA